MNEADILTALQKGVEDAVAASTLAGLPIKYLGRIWAKPDSGKWLEVVHIPNDVGDTWGDEITHRGSLRIILHWPNDDRGAIAGMERLRSISGYFTKGRWLDRVQITDTPKIGAALEDGSEMLYPCTLRYSLFVAN